MAICHCCVQRIKNPIQFWFSEFDKMKQKSEGIGLVVGRVQRIEEEAANASLLMRSTCELSLIPFGGAVYVNLDCILYQALFLTRLFLFL